MQKINQLKYINVVNNNINNDSKNNLKKIKVIHNQTSNKT